ncbi:MAG: SCO family protein [Ramlibacter sp.]|nr:SCO family protein [Ramlibacter sp.]
MWRRLEAAAPSLLLAAIVAGFGALAVALTEGGRAFTSEAWRRLRIEHAPVALPDVAYLDERGHAGRLKDLCGAPLVIDFVYTRCPTVCKAAGALSSQLARRLANAGVHASVLSLSIDPAYDTPLQLSDFKRRSEPEPSSWRALAPVSARELELLLRQLGVVVVADGQGGFEHNAAFHLVDRQCRVARIVDLEDLNGAETFALAAR